MQKSGTLLAGEYFENSLLPFNLSPAVSELFKMVVLDEFRSSNREELDERNTLSNLIEEQELILSKARKRYMKEEIDTEDYKAIKSECNETLRILEAKLADLPTKANGLKSIESLLDVVIDRYTDIQEHYRGMDLEHQRKTIGSIYPKNLCFDGVEHRTAYLSEPLSLIIMINSELHGNKRGEKLSFNNLSPQVARRGIEPLFLE